MLLSVWIVICHAQRMADMRGKIDSFAQRQLDSNKVKDELMKENLETNSRSSPLTENQLAEIDACQTKEELQSLMKIGRSASSTCYIPPGKSSCAPQFIIPGSMKCGTTSLYTYLQDHPQLLPLAEKEDGSENAKFRNAVANKEIRFLDSMQSFVRSVNDVDELFDRYYNFFQTMPFDKDFQLFSGDATPMYVCKENTAKRAYYANPEAKIIIMVREPIDRMWSETWFL